MWHGCCYSVGVGQLTEDSEMNSLELRKAIRSKYAWPGGYQMYGITTDGAPLCMDCLRSEYKTIAWARRNNDYAGWHVDSIAVNWEDDYLYCNHCDKRIESAYGERND